MLSARRFFVYALAAIAAARLFAMATMPFVDTSEPRYAEIARMMAASGDWITPWFTPELPFWGKPPLAFWIQALFIRAFGLSELAIRLSSMPAMAGMLWLCFVLGRRMASSGAARWAVLVFATMLLPAAAAGAVLTDPYLALGVAWSMTAFYMSMAAPSWKWRYGFFLGLAVGLLAKGPLAVVLVAGSIVPWALWARVSPGLRGVRMPRLPWVWGSILVAVLVLPWYIAAEMKTPGFLRYFILGEHFYRFIDAGWGGDLYGNAHRRARGSIWLDWLLATLPWGVAALAALAWRWRVRGAWRADLVRIGNDARWSFLLSWTLVTPLFFTFSGNIIWTYPLPALPPLAVWLGAAMPGTPGPRIRKALAVCLAVVPLAFAAAGIAGMTSPQRFKTEKELVAQAHSMMRPGERLYFVRRLPFSAQFYSRGTAGEVEVEDVETVIPHDGRRVFLAVAKGREDEIRPKLPPGARPVYESRLHRLFVVGDETPPAR
ncbi:ArnT family glycosyltransferase [Bordetella genomosp. 9]|uniref:Dolichyl-phosphate-mannose--protein mannosyltransferase n=1 Tax=Bordetella genomosp. 9 TaxID=1416803 RepID=A0A1W6Z2K2_9BORD|nr:glycosyltransferase family 39 protein [Bordetella genomosp. 9]ARP87548.1 dolichyl-phosphate-mannose--protein mannosyltransferase [Bordetella genomosp. 9]